MRAALKVEAIREDLGKVGPVIASRSRRRCSANAHASTPRCGGERREPAARASPSASCGSRSPNSTNARRDAQDFHLTPDRIANAVQVGLQLADSRRSGPIALARMRREAPSSRCRN